MSQWQNQEQNSVLHYCFQAPKIQGMNRNGRELKRVELQPWLCLRSCPTFSQVVISQAGCGLWQGSLRRVASVLWYHWSPPLCTSCGFHLSELPLYKQKKGPKLPHTCNTSNSNTFPFSPLLLNSLIFKNTTNTSKKWIILRYGVKWVLCVANDMRHITCPLVNLFVSVCQLHDETKTVTA